SSWESEWQTLWYRHRRTNSSACRGSPTRSCPKIMESTDEILASSSHRRNCRRRHCHCRSVLRLLGHDCSDRVDGDKLYALLVGSRWDARNGSRPDRNGGAASLDGFGIATGCS